MSAGIFISSVVLALVVLPLLAWKWNIQIKTAILGAVSFGVITGLIVNWMQGTVIDLHMVFLVLIELIFLLILTLIVILVRFYRDPERIPKETQNVILSPADGKVIYVNNVEEGSSLVATKGKTKFHLDDITSTNLPANAACMVGIDMNVLNVHVNRAPIEGEVTLQKRTKGRFMSLRKPESDIMNERVTTVISNGKFEVGVVQISSRLVRKILSYVNKGETLNIGQRIGSIVFGSQVNIVIPKLDNLRVEVEVDDEVKAGISVIARYRISEVFQND